MAMYSKVISKAIKPTGKELIDTRVDKRTRETGLMICNMGWEQKFLKMDQNIQVNSEMDRSTEWVSTLGQTGHIIKVSGITI
jgi:hypothetical protein